MATKRQVASWVKKIEKHREEVGKTRDRLSDTMDELSMLKECCDKAYDDLERAREALSELA